MSKVIFALLPIVLFCGCSSTRHDVLGTEHSQLQTRNYQSRAYDTKDKEMVLRSIISTMQDLGFIINKADDKLATVSGTSFVHNSKLTATARQVGSRIVVRINAQAGLNEITDPIPYQNFFNALSQSLFLEAHAVE